MNRNGKNGLGERTALVTGASRGIGRAIAEELGSLGATVIVNYNTDARAAGTVVKHIEQNGGQAFAVQADVGKADEAQRLVEEAMQRTGHLDILVNNAGINRDRTVRRMSIEEWDDVIRTNLDSIFYVTKAALDCMMERKYGRIVNISSLIGQRGSIGQANYAATKGGIIAFTKALALEVARFNITANALCPGYIETDMLSGVKDDIKQKLVDQIPLGRFGTAAEVAGFVRYLVTEGDWVTGQELNINGGMYM